MPLLAHLQRRGGGGGGGGACRFRPVLLPPGSHHMRVATFVDAKVKWVRDRGLDHAVEKEKHLRPMHALKNLLLRRPLEGPPAPGSLPLSAIAERRDELRLPFRAIRFIRKYPSVFVEEGSSSDDSRRPHVRATPELVRLHEEEQLLYQSCRGETADRLLRLLMLTPRKRIPLDVVDRLRWDLGLPDDYVRCLLPEYPDYFQIVPSDGYVRGGSSGGGGTGRLQLELVCWNKDLAMSAIERWAMRRGGYKKGDPLAFPLQFSRGFDMEKKVRRWVEEWQRLPYLSPYEDAGRHIDPGSDLGEKWTVGMLHELLHLLVSKKTERDDLLLLGECVGLRPGFKKVIFHHPGIFYMSNKIRAHTVVLREAYKRDLLVEKHALVGMRYQYIHLMRQSAAIDAATAPSHGTGGRRKRGDGRAGNALEGSCIDGTNGDGEGEEDEDIEVEEGEMSGDSQFESEDDESDDDDEDEESEARVGVSHMDNRFSVKRRMNRTEKRAVGAERSARSSSVHLSAVASHLRTRKVSAPFSRESKKCIGGS
ncbi:hypothetical protein Taro_024270 [Colocasia esculenta]|uniref:PORR domain-containing protein n=1 Tax=Colocasia esculenta TaxID=4460 RepID=A0A843V6D9_COLES|nr:hypothetical protein [Colocasia esculenta]